MGLNVFSTGLYARDIKGVHSCITAENVRMHHQWESVMCCQWDYLHTPNGMYACMCQWDCMRHWEHVHACLYGNAYNID